MRILSENNILWQKLRVSNCNQFWSDTKIVFNFKLNCTELEGATAKVVFNFKLNCTGLDGATKNFFHKWISFNPANKRRNNYPLRKSGGRTWLLYQNIDPLARYFSLI
jgi:hypothetical protein